MNKLNETPLWKRIIVMLGYIFLILIANNLGLASNLFPSWQGTWIEYLIVFIGLILAGLLIAFVYKKYRSYAPQDQAYLTVKDWLWNIGYFTGLRVVVTVLSLVIISLYGEEFTANDQAIIDSLTQGSTVFVISMVITMIIIAPMIEELVFRGIMTQYLFKGQKNWLVIIFSSLCFSMLHISNNWVSFALYFLMGVVLHLAYFRRGAIIDAIIVHGLNNLLASISLLYLLYTNQI